MSKLEGLEAAREIVRKSMDGSLNWGFEHSYRAALVDTLAALDSALAAERQTPADAPQGDAEELAEALEITALHLIAAISAYSGHVGRHGFKSKSDPFFETRVNDWIASRDIARAALAKYREAALRAEGTKT